MATKRAGTPFAMITLGIGELVAAAVLMLPGFFGGEAGITGNRVTGAAWFGIDFGSQLQMYYLIAGWTFASTVAMYAFTRTPARPPAQCRARQPGAGRIRRLQPQAACDSW